MSTALRNRIALINSEEVKETLSGTHLKHRQEVDEEFEGNATRYLSVKENPGGEYVPLKFGFEDKVILPSLCQKLGQFNFIKGLHCYVFDIGSSKIGAVYTNSMPYDNGLEINQKLKCCRCFKTTFSCIHGHILPVSTAPNGTGVVNS